MVLKLSNFIDCFLPYYTLIFRDTLISRFVDGNREF